MKIPGWTYILIGVVIGGISGYIYKFVPKNGEPNMAMALFFFIGIIFIIVGVIKIFFMKMDNDQDANFRNAKKELSRHVPMSAHNNRVEAHINKLYNQGNTQSAQSGTPQHTSGYARTHPYHPAHNTANTSVQNPQHTHHTAHNVASSMSIISCKKCGNKNPATANYCHNCGHGLR